MTGEACDKVHEKKASKMVQTISKMEETTSKIEEQTSKVEPGTSKVDGSLSKKGHDLRLGRRESGRFWKSDRDRFRSVIKSRGLKQVNPIDYLRRYY